MELPNDKSVVVMIYRYLFLFSLLVTGCVQDVKTQFSLGNSEECLWVRRQVSLTAIDKKDALYYCCPVRDKGKFYPVCVESFYVVKGKREW